MRKTHALACVAGVLLVAGCGRNKGTAMSDELKKDLDLASSSDGINLGGSPTSPATQVVSSIERTKTAPPSPAPSARAHRHRKAEAPPERVESEAATDIAEEAPTTVAEAPVATEAAPPISPRPQPIQVSYPGGSTGSVTHGPSAGEIFGAVLGAVIRGRVVGHGGIGAGEDRCDPRTDGRRGTGNAIIINGRFPIMGTFPGRR